MAGAYKAVTSNGVRRAARANDITFEARERRMIYSCGPEQRAKSGCSPKTAYFTGRRMLRHAEVAAIMKAKIEAAKAGRIRLENHLLAGR